MPIDTSIYQNLKTPQFNVPTPQDMMALSHLGMQQQMQQQQMQQQQALRQAYAQNTDENGNFNKQGVFSSLARMGMGHLIPEVSSGLSKQEKEQAEAQSARADAENKAVGVALPKLEFLAGAADDQKPIVFHNVMKELADKGMPMHNVPPEFSQSWLDSTMAQIKKTPTYLAQQNSQAELAEKQAKTAEAWSNVGMAPLKRNAEQFGSRSPNAELTSQYGAEAKPVRSSQMAMQQMLDNYGHHTPQGDASLILNAFKIKFPQAPDVNSLEELAKSESAPAQFKAAINQRVNGLLPDSIRDNLMRDGVSTYRANVESLRDIQGKYQDRAKFQNVSDPTMTAEPAIDKTYQKAMTLQDKIGPYVPPTERGGLMGAVSGAASKLMGSGESRPAKGPSDQIASSSANAKPAASSADTAAMKWLKTADPTSPEAFAIRAKLKKKGLL